MKIRIPKVIRINKKKFKDTVVFILVAIGLFAIFFGVIFAIRYTKYQSYYKMREAQCQQFTEYLNKEVLPLTDANVSDCECHYKNINVGKELKSNCLCSCKLYDENGTLIDDDWNPLFSST